MDVKNVSLANLNDAKKVYVFKCKAYLPIRSYSALLDFESTLVGDVLTDFVSPMYNVSFLVLIFIFFFLFID